MEITEVKVFPINEEKLKAFVSVVFDQCFMVNDIKVIQGKDGLFISMPSRKKKNGEFKDVAHPLNNGTRRMIEGQILEEYARVLEERGLTPRGGEEAVSPRPLVDRVDRDRGSDNGAVAARSSKAPKTAATEKPRVEVAQPRKTTEEKRQTEETEETGQDSLEEVQELHLKDSFWTV